MPNDSWHHYRFYALTRDGHVVGPSSSCRLPNDAAAVKHANLIIEDDAIEIWEGTRVVAHIAPNGT
jgi:hypothetical protein